MKEFQLEQYVTIFPFTQQSDGENIIIGNASHTVFLSIPASAVDILTWLAEGKTLGNVQMLYQERYGEQPDLEDFLALLEGENFLSTQSSLLEAAPMEPITQVQIPRSHFKNISQSTARVIISRPVLLSCALLVCVGLCISLFNPFLVPSPQVMIFPDHLLIMSLSIFAFVLFTIFLHEMAHLLAARAADIPARIGISHRLWILVAETDMTGIWMASRRQRYLAFLAGPILDATSGSILLIFFYIRLRLHLFISPLPLQFLQAALFTYMLRLLWQCYFFVRTDFYYVVANFFNCKNLMNDTEVFLRNLCRPILPFLRYVDQDVIPSREKTIIRFYAVVWVVGRCAAIAMLVFITFPIAWGYITEISHLLFGGHPATALEAADVIGWIIVVSISLIMQSIGFFLWLRSFFLLWRSTHVPLE